ncbi:MAG: GWxTD domain-containing protein [Candidatus Marinimicrobia bacterium]|nr:GWxTD domain-containing protein [Candidatus Neomarinimicrobiota bacterium]
MAKSILTSAAKIFFVIILIIGCSDQAVKPEKDLTLPDFSFVGLSEPLADKKNIKVSVHVKIPYTELQFTRTGDRFLARYEIGVNIADQDNERIAGKIWSDSLWLDSYQDTRKTDNKVMSEYSFVVPASELMIKVRVTDLYTKKSRILSDEVDHSKMYAGALALGNIMLIGDRPQTDNDLLMDQSFYEIIDTLQFQARLMGERQPYTISYELIVKNELKLSHSMVLDHEGPVDSLLTFTVPLTDMHFTNYTLKLKAEDGDGNTVNTRTHFRVRIRGINFDVGNLEEAVRQLIYIADDRVIRKILSGSDERIAAEFKEFWASIDPTPGSPENELMAEYYRRVAFSIEAFTVVQDGWRTDRGMIYILFGPPDEIQRGPFELDRKPYQVWEYYRLGKQFVFSDETGFGDYRLDKNYLNQNDWRFRY